VLLEQVGNDLMPILMLEHKPKNTTATITNNTNTNTNTRNKQMDDHKISFTITKTSGTETFYDIHIDDEYLDTVSSYEEAEAKMKCALQE
jgi:hypothetical protein